MEEDTVQVSVDTDGMAIGSYQATITIEAEPWVLDSPAQTPVKPIVAEEI
jgi:hypothetical protein